MPTAGSRRSRCAPARPVSCPRAFGIAGWRESPASWCSSRQAPARSTAPSAEIQRFLLFRCLRLGLGGLVRQYGARAGDLLGLALLGRGGVGLGGGDALVERLELLGAALDLA